MSILVAVDGGPNSENVVETGFDLATAFDTELFVIHVLTESEYESRAEGSDFYRDDAREDAVIVAERVVDDAKGSSGDITTVGRVGDPPTEVIEFAEKMDAQYIVIGGRRRSPAGKAVFGSDAQQILLNATAPVVSVMGLTNAPE